MAELGVPPHVIEAMVNHVSGHKGGVAGIYNRAAYMPERKAALELWADHVSIRRRETAMTKLRQRIIDKMPAILELIASERRPSACGRR